MDTIITCLFLSACFVGIFAPIAFHEGNCTDAKGIHHKDGDVWYPRGECAKYGCFIRNDVLVRYKESCPDYPAPDCRFHLKSDPLGPFPECCYVPRCNTG
ncbi:U-scoloptoxin(16)-Er12a-like isoform X2 [Gigantopelta aegis]|uniref:U-scoloptoxin(16)-Er12a-like isoform X2 n=1 Tax=Gigantopelta aegis TaxID=1735272 RepID=UPI001B88C9AA|nr:U-scoloptoxin(16)-Er12a-like isoform X2 [Gigantopelta aegis]